MIIKSPAFKEGGAIPAKFTCEGDNVNPFLELRGTPHEAKSLVLLVDDPDATYGGVWDHWLVWNIDPKTQYIEEDTIPPGSIEGKTSFGSSRYGGPCPPVGAAPHRYRFQIFALNDVLHLESNAGRAELLQAMEGHIIDQGETIGVFGR